MIAMLLRTLAIVVLFTGPVIPQKIIAPDARLEPALLKGYNKKHRPVKDEGTTVNVAVLIAVTHIEKVSEEDQTIQLHGTLWARWVDEYLKWNPADYNNTQSLPIDTWKIWQPALSLYNSARGNQWQLYLSGAPASVKPTGHVEVTGSFSFHVTCLFDFARWPFDSQECPIVIADWVYDLSRVNLSEQLDQDMNPYLSLNYDPFDSREKRYVSGWEVTRTWRRHCYWGMNGCKDELPEGQPEWYWSLLEFGIEIKRHSPYNFVTITIPTLIAAMITLSTYWVDSPHIPPLMLGFNLFFQGLYGWELIRNLPPGSGSIPSFVLLFGANCMLAVVAFFCNILTEVGPEYIPKDLEMPTTVTSLMDKLHSLSFFNAKGFSFDPQELLSGGGDEPSTEPVFTQTISSSRLDCLSNPSSPPSEVLLQLDDGLPNGIVVEAPPTAAPEATSTAEAPPTSEAPPPPSKSVRSVAVIIVRRALFLLSLIIYMVLFIMYFFC